MWRRWAPDWWQFPIRFSRCQGVVVLSFGSRAAQVLHRLASPKLAENSMGVCLSAYQGCKNVSLPLSSPSIPHIPTAIPCPRFLIQPSPPPPSRFFLMLPWRSTLSKLGKISATTHSPPRSMAAIVLILSFIYSKNKPGRLTNSRMAMPNYLGGLDPSSMCCTPSLPTKPLETALVT